MPSRRQKIRRAQQLDTATPPWRSATSGGQRGRPARPRRARVPQGRQQPARIPRGPTLTLKGSVDAWDAYGKVLAPPSATALGNFTTINGQTKNQFKVGNAPVYALLSWTPSGTKGVIYTATGTTPAVVDWIFTPQMTTTNYSAKPLRLSSYILNGNKWPEGIVDVLGLPEQFPWTDAFVSPTPPAGPTLTSVFVNGVATLVDSHAKSLSYKASVFNSRKRFVMGPASYIGYQGYLNSDRSHANPEDALIDGASAFAMTTLIIRFNPVPGTSTDPNTQYYTMKTYSQDGCRYPATVALASMARPQPPVPPSQHQLHHEMGSLVSQIASTAHDTGEVLAGAALARYGPSLVGSARNAIAAGGARLAGAMGLGGAEVAGAMEMAGLAAPLLLL